MAGHASRGVVFPPLNVKTANLHHLDGRTQGQSSLPLSGGAIENVQVKDLSWEDKELVLRVLFAKMNGKDHKGPSQHGQGTASSMPMPQPVFISEGGGSVLPPHEYESNVRFQESYEVCGGESEGYGEDQEEVHDGGDYEVV